MKKHFARIVTGLVLVLVFLLQGLGILNLGFLRQLELWSYDQRLNMTLPGGQDERIVIVDIDEKSLAEIGRWPWSRNQVAELLDRLFKQYKVAVVGFDVVFAELDTSSGIRELERLADTELRDNAEFRRVLGRNRQRLDYDALLAARLSSYPVVLGYYFADEGTRTAGRLPAPVFRRQELPAGRTSIAVKNGYGANIPVLQQAARSAGHFNPDPDRDGVTRRVPMLQQFRDGYYESLSLAVMRTLYGQPALQPGFPSGDMTQLEWLQAADLRVPVDASATALIPYRGNRGSFPYLSAADVLKGRVAQQQLENAVVLVGTTAPGLMDLRSTPVSAVYPGVEVHANMIAGMLDNSIKHAPSYAVTVELVTLLLLGLLLAVLLPSIGPLASLGLSVLLAALVLIGNLVAWQQNLVLPLASGLVLVLVLYFVNATWGFLVEAHAKHLITGLFGQYVPPQIVSVMSRDPEHFTMAAEEREMTVLFSDVVGFTTISESLEPKVLAQLMNDYLSAMTAVIYEHGGTVDKYIGDAIMAFWGAPLGDPDHARHAVQAALAMQQRMESLRAEFAGKGLPQLMIGIGINSGTMRVGNMGSSFRVAYTAMGDAVNLASRLEGLTRQYGVWVIAGEATRAQVSDYVWRELDMVQVKGKQEPVKMYEPCRPVSG